MLKEIMLFIKYPYTAGVIAIIWIGSAILMAINKGLPSINIVAINMVVSVVIAGFGFTGKNQA